MLDHGGVQMTLMIGPAYPIPVSRSILDALQSVRITVNARDTSFFELKFTVSKSSALLTTFMIAGGGAIPLVRVVIVATVNGTPNVLIDGVMTNHQLAPGSNGEPSTLTIMGEDLSRVLSYIDFSGIPYPATPVEGRVLLVLAKYAVLGIIPMVIPSILLDVPIPTSRIPRQQGNDLEYIRALADEVGYVFYIDPGPQPGMSFAYWGPEIKVGTPQPALNVDMDAHTNVEQLSFRFDTENRMLPIVVIQNPETKVPIPIPILDITPLIPPLARIPAPTKGIAPIAGVSKYGPIQALLIGLAKAAKSADALSASGSLNVVRYGHVLKARQLVGVRGAGSPFNGLYYVQSVTHNIRRGEYKQDFTLVRNGLVSTLDTVPA